MEVFQQRLTELRKEAKISQKELAKWLDTTNSSVCDWERGRSMPDLNMLTKIAKVFSVSADYLLGLED